MSISAAPLLLPSSTIQQKVKFTPLTAKERFTALQSGEVDILSRNTTWTMSRDTSLGLKFAGVMYYDGQGFMVKNRNGRRFGPQAFRGCRVRADRHDDRTEPRRLFQGEQDGIQGRCLRKGRGSSSAPMRMAVATCYTTDQSGIYAQRLKLAKPDDHMVLPEIISKEPLGPLVRQGDDAWFNVVKWTYYALLNAEELGITQANVEEMKGIGQSGNQAGSRCSECRRHRRGLWHRHRPVSEDWVVQIVKGVGNYGEIFERNVGANTPLKIARGRKCLVEAGGLQYAPPIR